MTAPFVFRTDAKSEAFLKEVISEMVARFAISEKEAVIRINASWKSVGDFTGEQHVFYHEDPAFYASDIFYGHDSAWWFVGEIRKEKNLAPLRPVPLEDSR
jgi:hypothetical protein